MGRRGQTRRQQLSTEAIDPITGERMVVMYSQEKLQAIAKRSLGQVKEAAFAVPMILQQPKAIFRGLRREADEPARGGGEGWLCYCGIPLTAYNEDGSPRDPWPEEVMMVFVVSERIVYNWYWYPCDPDDPNLPEDHSVRFRERVL